MSNLWQKLCSLVKLIELSKIMSLTFPCIINLIVNVTEGSSLMLEATLFLPLLLSSILRSWSTSLCSNLNYYFDSLNLRYVYWLIAEKKTYFT